MSDDREDGPQGEGALAAPPGPRFGERLRSLLARWVGEDEAWAAEHGDRDRHPAFGLGHLEEVLGALAADIDADTEELEESLPCPWCGIRRAACECPDRIVALKLDLRRRIEEAIKEETWHLEGGYGCDVVTVAALHDALSEIFGDRPAEEESGL